MVEEILRSLDKLLERVEQVEKDLIAIAKENAYLREALEEVYKRNKELIENKCRKKVK